jgi:(p)ppGpp synthase/HD superfamily hydrolase
MKTLDDAIAIAVKAHRGQKDKGSDDYILHPLRVMLAMPRDDELRIIAVLHDVIEDTGWTLSNLRELGFSERVLESLSAISRNEYEPYFDYIKRCALGRKARSVKLADLRDNLDKSRIHVLGYDQQDRYRKAIEILEGVE